MKENIDNLFSIVDEMLDKADPTYRKARESYSLSEQVKMLMLVDDVGRKIPAPDVTQWAIRLSEIARDMAVESCNTK